MAVKGREGRSGKRLKRLSLSGEPMSFAAEIMATIQMCKARRLCPYPALSIRKFVLQ